MFTRRIFSLALFATLSMTADNTNAAPIAEPAQAHMVFFTLAEPTDTNRDALIAACHKHLAGHDGVVYFSVGGRAKEMTREVNDKGFDVALHVVFKDQAAHNVYQTHPRHLAFIKEAKSLWSGVRVFDSNLSPAPSAAASEDQ